MTRAEKIVEIAKSYIGQEEGSHCVYYLHDYDNYLCGYIGYSSNLKARLKFHFSNFKKQTIKTAWISSRLNDGVNIGLEILETVKSREEACFWEQFYISYYKSLGFSLKNGTFGGDGGVPSSEVREKMSKNRKGVSTFLQQQARSENGKRLKGRKRNRDSVDKMILKIKGVKKTLEHIEKVKATKKALGLNLPENNPMFGKKHTSEALTKMRTKKLGKKSSSDTILKQIEIHTKIKGRPVIVCEMNSEIEKHFKSIRAASRSLGVSHQVLNATLHGKQKTFDKGKTIKYVNS